MGWGSDAIFNVNDFFTTSAAEGNWKKYCKVIDDLERELEKIATKLTEVADNIIDIHTSMRKDGDPSLGKMITDFESKREENKTKLDNLVSEYKALESDVKSKLEVAKVERDRWRAIADAENAAKKEYEEAQRDK